jgi:hypothetical protein
VEFASDRQHIITANPSRPKPRRPCIIYTRFSRSVPPWEWAFSPIFEWQFQSKPYTWKFHRPSIRMELECKQLPWISEFRPHLYRFKHTAVRNKPIVWSCWKYDSFRATIIDRETHHSPPNKCWSSSTFSPNARGHGRTLSFTLWKSTTLVPISTARG